MLNGAGRRIEARMSALLPAYGWPLLNVDEVVHGGQASAFRNALWL
jgi:hypothetical protein